MPEYVLTESVRMRKSNVSADIPSMKIVLPKDEEMARIVADHVKARLDHELRSAPANWASFASWLENNLRVVNGGIEWPASAAAERMGRMGINPKWLDEAIGTIIKDAIK